MHLPAFRTTYRLQLRGRSGNDGGFTSSETSDSFCQSLQVAFQNTVVFTCNVGFVVQYSKDCSGSILDKIHVKI